MTNRIGSIVLGAGLAALVTLPAKAGDNDWIKQPARNFEVKALKIENTVGVLTIDVKNGGPVVLEVNGVEWKVKRLNARREGDTLKVDGGGGNKVWDWQHWFDFSSMGQGDTRNLYVHLVIPKGMAVDVEGQIGKAVIGDTEGPLKFETAGDADARIGNVAGAKIEMAGSGKVMVGNVAGDLHTETSGSGDIRAGDAGDTHTEIAGSGSVVVGHVKALHVEIAGSGDFSAAAVNGATHIEIAGSGSASIAGGEAKPLHVEIMGSGNFSLGGVAVDPNIEVMGSGNVSLKSYRGKLTNEGNANLKIGG
jgi:hypothetical protein